MIKPSVGRVVWFYKFNAVTGAAGAAQRRAPAASYASWMPFQISQAGA